MWLHLIKDYRIYKFYINRLIYQYVNPDYTDTISGMVSVVGQVITLYVDWKGRQVCKFRGGVNKW